MKEPKWPMGHVVVFLSSILVFMCLELAHVAEGNGIQTLTIRMPNATAPQVRQHLAR